MTTQAHAPQKQFYIVTGMNFVSVDIELFTDPLAYGRALRETERQHARGEVEAYTCGDNMVNNDRKNPVYGGLYIASMSDMGATAEFFADETEYLDRLLTLKSEDVDALDYNGPDIDFDPDAEDDNDNEETAVVAP
jgi:hypothetical protein